MQYWKAHYKDASHDVDIKIENTEEDYSTNPLSFTLDGVKFQGTSLGDFQLADDAQYDYAKDRFWILKWGGMKNGFKHISPYYYELQRYTLDVEIPIKIVQKWDDCEISGMLHIAFEYVEHDRKKNQCRILCDDVQVYRDDAIVSDFSLCVDGVKYSSTKKSLDFETALYDISMQIKQKYCIKSCFTCQYSDYSPYGNDDYGTMLCYSKDKEACLKVNGKDDFFEFLEGKKWDGRQETYLCEEYDIRNKACGYRGFLLK